MIESEKEYIVNAGKGFVKDFGRSSIFEWNVWERAYIDLYPCGMGALNINRNPGLTVKEYVQWALHYHDRRFRTHPISLSASRLKN